MAFALPPSDENLTHVPRFRGYLGATAVALSSAPATAQANLLERDVNVPMACGVSDSALFCPEGKGPWPAVLVWTDILSLRPMFREMGSASSHRRLEPRQEQFALNRVR